MTNKDIRDALEREAGIPPVRPHGDVGPKFWKRRRIVDADLIPIAPDLPVLEVLDGGFVYVNPKNGELIYSQGDGRACPKGHDNSSIAAYCATCRTVLPLNGTATKEEA